jgi:hypothetical protein
VNPEVAAFHRTNTLPLAVACVLAEDRGDNLLGAIEHAKQFTSAKEEAR